MSNPEWVCRLARFEPEGNWREYKDRGCFRHYISDDVSNEGRESMVDILDTKDGRYILIPFFGAVLADTLDSSPTFSTLAEARLVAEMIYLSIAKGT